VSQAAGRIAAGELQTTIPVSSEDEVGQLAAALNTMSVRLSELFRTLESRVAERTEQLAVARDEALEATRAKSIFLANMSHELRTPLNAIIGYAELVEEECLDQGQNSFISDLKKIQAAARHQLALINDILDLSKIEAGRMQLYLEDVTVEKLVQDVI